MRIAVTGAASGIGREVARRLRETGHEVRACDLHDAERLDVTDEAAVTEFFASAPLDALVHCAGCGIFKPFDAFTSADWAALLSTNVTGAYLTSREAARAMPQGGRIVHFGSLAAARPLPGSAAYGASKAALRMLCQSMNEELGPAGIRTTYLTLGAVYTDIWRSRPEFSASDMLSVADVAQAVQGILETPLHVRIDEMTLLPPKGAL